MLKAGIIGLGVGEAHIAGYHAHPGCRVVALCDFSDEKRSMARRRYPGMMITDNDQEILQNPDIDVISIASYDNYHYEQIMTALNCGKHVFVEKPLCLYEVEARGIRQALRERPHLRMSSNLILRKSPRFIDLRQSIRDGKLGELFHIEGDYNYGRLHKITNGWRGEIDFYSVVYGGGIHMIDLLLWLTDDPIVEVAAFGNGISSRGSGFRYNDMAVSILRFASGMTGKVTANFGCVHPHFHALCVYGTEATFINGRDRALLFESRDPNDEPQNIETAYPGAAKGNLIYSLVDAILNDKSPDVTPDDIFRAMSVCFAIEKATRLSSVVRVEYL